MNQSLNGWINKSFDDWTDLKGLAFIEENNPVKEIEQETKKNGRGNDI